MEEVNQNQTIQEQIPAEQVEPKPSFLKKLRKIGVILFSFLIFLIFAYMFLAMPRKTIGKPIKPFYYGQTMLAEKVSYLFTDPKEGDRVLFKTDERRMDFFGVITAIENKDNILTYKIVSSDPINPWVVTRDKIIGKIYYPFIKNEEVLKIISSQLPIPTPSPNLDSIETWKTYTDNRYGFSFKYPSIWRYKEKVSKDTGYEYIINFDEVSIIIFKSNLAMEDFINPSSSFFCDAPGACAKFTDFKDIKVGSISGKKIINPPSPISSEEIILKKSPYFFILRIITATPDGQEQTLPKRREYFDQILSTFKFIDQNQTIDTSNWKTYTSTKNRISFKYPPEWGLKVEPNSYTGFDQISITLNKKYPHPNKPSEYIEGIDKQFTIYPVTDNGQHQFTNWVPNTEAVFDGRKCQGKVIEATQQVGAETYYECIVNGINYGISLVTVTDNNASSYATLNLIRSTFKFTQ